METGWSPDEIFEGTIINKNAVYTTWNGVAITQTNFAKICNISHTSLIKYRKNNLSDEEIFNLGIRPLGKKLNGKTFVHDGIEYPTLTAFNQSILRVPMSTASKWTTHFKLTAEQCVRIVELARKVSVSQDLSYSACLRQASDIITGKKPLLILNGHVITQNLLKSYAKINLSIVKSKIKEGMNAEDIMEWVSANRGKLYNKIDPVFFEGQKFFSYAELDRHLGCPAGYAAKCQRKGLNVTETKTLILLAKDEMNKGYKEGIAYMIASRKYFQTKRGGKKLSSKVANYISLRRAGVDPKKSCEQAGLSKSNSSRLEKAHKKLIDSNLAPLRT